MKIFAAVLVVCACAMSRQVFADGERAPTIEWQRTFGGGGLDIGMSVQQTADGGYIVAGQMETFTDWGYRIYLLKLDAEGSEQWSRTFGHVKSEAAVEQTPDGGYIVCGYGAGEGMQLIKTDESGNEVWPHVGQGGGYDCHQTSDGGYIGIGETGSWMSGSYRARVVKSNSEGHAEWDRTYGYQGLNSNGRNIVETPDGGFAFAGGTVATTEGDTYLFKIDRNGNEVWSSRYGDADRDNSIYSLEVAADGGFIMTGSTRGNDDNLLKIYLLKTDEQGNEEWEQIFDVRNGDIGYGVIADPDGYVVAAMIGNSADTWSGRQDGYVLKVDLFGNEMWHVPIDYGTDAVSANGLAKAHDGGYIVTGLVKSLSENPGNVLVVKLSSPVPGVRFVRGDTNPDSTTDISDAIAILGYLFLGVNKVPCEQAADANDDGALDISDAVYVLGFLFLGGKPIEPPVGTCGVDPTGHSLPCESFLGCQ